MQKSRECLDPLLYQEAESAFNRALAKDPGSAHAWVGLAWVHNTRHDFQAGTRCAKAALALDPHSVDAFSLLGDAAVELGDYDAAYEFYQQALDHRPDLASYSRAAHLLWLTGNAVHARQLLRMAIAAGGPYAENSAWCRAQLALMLFNGGDLSSAEQEVELALRMTPKNPHVLAAAGRIKAARDQHEAAMDLCRRSIEIMPTHDALVTLTDLYSLTGRAREAERSFQQVVAFHAAHASTHHTHGPPHPADDTTGHELSHTHAGIHGNAQLARFYADHHRELDQALAEAKAAYHAFPNVLVADTLAWCYHKKGFNSEAVMIIRQALKWDTPSADLHFHAGMIYAELGNRPLAQKHLDRALSLNPHFHPVFATVARLLVRSAS